MRLAACMHTAPCMLPTTCCWVAAGQTSIVLFAAVVWQWVTRESATAGPGPRGARASWGQCEHVSKARARWPVALARLPGVCRRTRGRFMLGRTNNAICILFYFYVLSIVPFIRSPPHRTGSSSRGGRSDRRIFVWCGAAYMHICTYGMVSLGCDERARTRTCSVAMN